MGEMGEREMAERRGRRRLKEGGREGKHASSDVQYIYICMYTVGQ